MKNLARGFAAAALLVNLAACADLGTLGHLQVGSAARVETSAPLAQSFAHSSGLGQMRHEAAALGPLVQMPDLSASEPEIIRGAVSWYGPRFAGRKTANGEIFDPRELTMAHRKLPFNTRVRVTNADTGASVVVRVNDRGPYVGDRVADLSHAAAKRIGMVKSGVIAAELEVLADEEADYDAAGDGQGVDSDSASQPDSRVVAVVPPSLANGSRGEVTIVDVIADVAGANGSSANTATENTAAAAAAGGAAAGTTFLAPLGAGRAAPSSLASP